MEKVADAESFRGEDGFLKVELKEAESRGVGAFVCIFSLRLLGFLPLSETCAVLWGLVGEHPSCLETNKERRCTLAGRQFIVGENDVEKKRSTRSHKRTRSGCQSA